MRSNRAEYLAAAALVLWMSAPSIVLAACVALSPASGGASLALVSLAAREPAFRITYTHSVTNSAVEERYVVDGDRIVQNEIRFTQHGPGLPTAPDEGGTFEQHDGVFVVRGRRVFERIVMRVDPAQRPMLDTPTQALDLARWGRRALALTASTADCDAP